jgi:hypothetical protein
MTIMFSVKSYLWCDSKSNTKIRTEKLLLKLIISWQIIFVDLILISFYEFVTKLVLIKNYEILKVPKM